MLAALTPLLQRLRFTAKDETQQRYPSDEAGAEEPPAFVDTQATWMCR
ncbi:hypothetical protein [Piscinibacter terrae]|nr:hypothetical protein [Albitalea terrae]